MGNTHTNNETIVATSEEKNSAKTNMKRRITFKLHAPGAKSVHLAGTFNEWNARSHPLRQDKRSRIQGMWQRIFYLEPGVYEYRFIVDGRGQDGPRATEPLTNEFGSFNCVIWV
jgi:1,4-alpha-glucan branching enzyme